MSSTCKVTCEMFRAVHDLAGTRRGQRPVLWSPYVNRSRRTCVWLLTPFAIALIAPAHAQGGPDHLTCFKVKDPQVKATYTADLDSFAALPGCTIKVPAVMACTPTIKSNVTPPPTGDGGTGTPNAFGCYKVKCPKASLPAIPLNDQFGTRSVTPKAPKLLCAPAASTTTSSSSSSTTTVTSPTMTTTTSACVAAGQTCSAAAECCSGICCGEAGASCATSADCCGGICDTVNTHLCSGGPGGGGFVCGAATTTTIACLPAGQACTNGSNCCSGVCCGELGAPCATSIDCCGGVCDVISTHVCTSGPPGGIAICQ